MWCCQALWRAEEQDMIPDHPVKMMNCPPQAVGFKPKFFLEILVWIHLPILSISSIFFFLNKKTKTETETGDQLSNLPLKCKEP